MLWPTRVAYARVRTKATCELGKAIQVRATAMNTVASVSHNREHYEKAATFGYTDRFGRLVTVKQMDHYLQWVY